MFCFCTGKKEEAAKDTGFVDVAPAVADTTSVSEVSTTELPTPSASRSAPLPPTKEVEAPALSEEPTIVAAAAVEKEEQEPTLNSANTVDKISTKVPVVEQVVETVEETKQELAVPTSELPAPVEVAPAENPQKDFDTDEFMTMLKRLDKENAWKEKRQAKKAGAKGKKKSKRNNKAKANTNVTTKTASGNVPLKTRN